MCYYFPVFGCFSNSPKHDVLSYDDDASSLPSYSSCITAQGTEVLKKFRQNHWTFLVFFSIWIGVPVFSFIQKITAYVRLFPRIWLLF